MIDRQTFLPYALPSLGDEEISEVVQSLRSGWITTGPKVKQFEAEFAAYTGAKHAVAVSSCTGGLEIALRALDVGAGDDVIVPTLTFCATANVVVHLGATPVIVDVDDAGLMTADVVRNAITNRTRAIVPVHYAGQACNMDELTLLSVQHGIPLVEDAAHATGCTFRNTRIGTHSSSVVFSFYATKNMTTGEGGMITTNDGVLAERMRVLTLHGMSRDAWSRYTQAGSWYYEVVEAGYKFNMTDIQAALGIHQLRRLDSFTSRRREIAAKYDAAFRGIPELRIPDQLPERNHVYHLYPLRVSRSPELNRDTMIEDLKAALIGTSVHFIPLHRHPFYRDRYNYKPEQFPMAERMYPELLSLPLYPRMTDDDVLTVIDAVIKSVSRRRESPCLLEGVPTTEPALGLI